jgi:hypothetical protein
LVRLWQEQVQQVLRVALVMALLGSVPLVVELLVQVSVRPELGLAQHRLALESARRRQVELPEQQEVFQQVLLVLLEWLELQGLRRMESSMERRCTVKSLRMSIWVRTAQPRNAIRMRALRYKPPANSCFV